MIVDCNDGTQDVDNGNNVPCANNGGVKGSNPAPTKKGMTDTQKWGVIVGASLIIYYILYKAGSLK